MDLADFDEMASHIENLSSALKVFGAAECTASTHQDGSRGLPPTSIVVYGDKVILQNLPKQQKNSGKTAQHSEYDEDIVHTGAGELNCKSQILAAMVPHGTGTTVAIAGTVVFHIDNTSSMLRDKRMQLTKGVLSKVIPNFLRMGYRVVVNSWASTQENKGKINTREVKLDQALLDVLQGHATAAVAKVGGVASSTDVDDADSSTAGDAADSGNANLPDLDRALQQYLEEKVFDILVPKGRTDLYGSCFQLLRQCKSFLSASAGDGPGPVHAFVLTDGEHNILDFPTHHPRYEGEDYFGVYSAAAVPAAGSGAKPRLKFVRSGQEPSVPGCEQFLRSELDVLNGTKTAGGDCGSDMSVGADSGRPAAFNGQFSLTFIGIGELKCFCFCAFTFIFHQEVFAFS